MMVDIKKIKTDIQDFYWNFGDREEDIIARKLNYERIFQYKNTDDFIEVFENLLNSLRGKLTCEVNNSSVTYFPSSSFRVILNVEKYDNYTIISEYHFYISILTNVYTGYFMKAVINKIKINSKMRNIILNPLIITSSIESYQKEFELICNEIIDEYPKFEFLSLENCLVKMEAKNVTYTVNELNLFHLLFADFKKQDYKILTTRHNKI